MRENTKRLLTLVMAVSMILSMMPISVSAQEQASETPTQQETVQTLPEIEVEVDNPLAASNSPETATPLSLDAWYYADISEQGQKVYFSFTPTESGTYMMRANINDSACIELLDADGNVLNTGWGGNSLGHDPLVYNELTAGQTYYYAVSFSTYAWETTGTIPVALSRSTLTNLEFEPINLIENTGGIEEEYGYYYSPNFFLTDFQCTATFSDGTTLTSSGDGFTYNGLYYGIWGYPDQSAENPWTVGNTYTMEVSCMGLIFDVPVSIVSSPVVSLDIQPITVIENNCGTESFYWDQETETMIPFYQYVEWQLMHKTSFTATLSDGTVISSNTHTFEYNGETCYLQMETNQYESPWTAGNTYTMKVTMLGKTVEVPVTVDPIPLVSLEFTPVSVIENTTGGLTQDWNPDTQQYDLSYYHYSTWYLPNMSTYTATFTDGTVLTGSGSGLEYNGQWYDFDCDSDQSYENQWTVGNTYTFTVTMMGKTVEVPVSIIEVPIVNLESTDVWHNAEITAPCQKVFFSFTPTESGTYLFRSNTSSDTFCELYDADNNLLSTDDDSGSDLNFLLPYQLTAGQTYRYAVRFLDEYATGTIPVLLELSPLVSLEFTPVSVIENTTGGLTQDWNPDTQQYDPSYYCYSIWDILNNSTYTATFTDGTVLTGSDSGLEYDGQWYDFDCDNEQSYDNQWTADNTYTVAVSLMGKAADLSISITPIPLVSLEFSPVSVIENTTGGISQDWNPDTQQYDPSYYCYSIWDILNKSTYTATFTDGTVLTGSGSGLEYKGQWYDFGYYNVQSYDNQWTVGNTYNISVTLMEKTVYLPVTITPSPVVSLEIAPISVMQNTCGHQSSYWDDATQTNAYYYYYSEWQLMWETSFTATLLDGTVITGNRHHFDYNGETYYFDLSSEQDHSNPWTVGNTYTMKVTMLGKTVEVPVTITDVPLVSLTFTPVNVTENTCGEVHSGWNEDTGSFDLNYYHYYTGNIIERSTYTATFTDGTVLTGSGYGFDYNGQWYGFSTSDNQDYYNQWTVGNTYTVPVEVMGKQTELSITITPTPLVSLEFTPVTFMEGTNGDWYSNHDPENPQNYYRYSIWNALEKSTYTATFTDGTIITGNGSSLIYNGEEYYFNEALVSQSYESPWTAGNSYYFAVGCMGKTFQLPVTIEKSPLESISINPISVIENTCGYWNTGYDNGQAVDYYFYSPWQLISQSSFTLTFADGTVQTGSGSGFYYNGDWYGFTLNYSQGFYDQWTVGNTYSLQVSAMGKTVVVPITICKSPIVSVEVDPILLAENQDGYWDGYWGETGYVEYFRYSWQSQLRYTITMEDGTTVTGSRYGFTYNDQWYEISIGNNQSWEDPWLPGNTYAVDISFPGYETQVAISVCAASFNDSYSYIVQGNKAIITDCHLTDEVIQIPDTIDGNTVVGITYLGFALDHALELSIPDSVTMLSGDVFGIWGYYEYVNVPLQKLHLGSGVSGVSPDMLMWLRNLEQITVSAENQLYTSVDGVLYNKDVTEMIVYPFGKTSHHVIPDSVEYIDVIFEYGENYKAIDYKLGAGIKDYAELDGVIYTKDMTEVVACTARATGDYVMPDSVTDIRKLAFANSQLTSVTVSPNVTSIVYAGFYGCDKLQSITLPEKLESIEMLAFDGCTSLQSISLPESVTYIGSSAFYDCYRLSAVYAESLESWCSICFEGSNANPLKFAEKLYIDGQLLTDLVIPNVSDLVYDYAFYNAQLNSITVPSYVHYIGRSAFYGTSAQSLTLSENLEGINPEAFAYSNIQSVKLPDSLRYLGYQAFYRCENLESLTFGNQLVEIGSDSFAYTGLTSVVLPENIEYVGSCAFQNSQLKEVTFDCESVYIGDNAFENCPLGDLDLQENIQGFDYEAFAGTLATKVNIPSTVTGLTYREFAFSYNLVSVTIPDSVESIGDECFRGDSNLSHVLYTGTEEQWNNMDIGSQEILDAMVHFNATGDEVTTQQTCTQVSFYCSICEQWETVNKVKANHNMVDGTCTVCGHVGDWEYQIREEDNTVIITGYSGSEGNLEIPETIQGKPVTAIAPGAFENVSGIYSVSLPDNLEVIGAGAFENAPHLYNISFGKNLKVIDDFAFAGCERLNNAQLPEGLEVIGNGAFEYCYWIQSIYIPESVTTIGDYAFDCCYHLEKIQLPEGLKRIGDYTFYSTMIQSIDIPDTVTEIGYSAFQWCERLETITIPASVTEISYDAFSENFSLSLIIFEGDAPEIAPIAFSGVYAEAIYDADNDSWTDDVLQGYNGELFWLGCSAPRITKQLKDVYADESGLATVTTATLGMALTYNWYGAMPGEEFELLDHDYDSFSMKIDETNSGYQIYCLIADPLGRTVTTKTVTMKLAPTMTGIEITKLPNTVEYDLNQGLRTTGMVVMGHYSDGTRMEITNYQITGYKADQSGVQTITVAYGGFTDTYTVTVKQEALNFTSTEQKIEISAPVGAIETGAELVVEQVNVAEDFPEIPPIILDNEYIVYDIGFEKEGEAVQPTEEVEVSIPVPDYMAGMGCKIFYVDDQNNAVDMEARFEDGFMVFTVPHFSYYAIVQMPGVHITGQITGADNAVVNLKQGDEVVHTTQAEDGIYNFECVAEGLYTLEVVADELDPYITELLVGMKDIAQDILMMILGDFTGDNQVTNEDVIHLLWHTLFPETYPAVGKADFTGDGEVTNEDVIHLLWHTLFPETYPLS